jgi:hypothetical protein
MIDMTKKYQTRSGLPVRIYATDGAGRYPVHGAIKWDGGWDDNTWCADGSYADGEADGSRSLVSAKAWREWKEGEGPARMMIRWNNHCKDSVEVVHRDIMYSNAYLFESATWLHEDGSETPCGVFE